MNKVANFISPLPPYSFYASHPNLSVINKKVHLLGDASFEKMKMQCANRIRAFFFKLPWTCFQKKILTTCSNEKPKLNEKLLKNKRKLPLRGSKKYQMSRGKSMSRVSRMPQTSNHSGSLLQYACPQPSARLRKFYSLAESRNVVMNISSSAMPLFERRSFDVFFSEVHYRI